MRTKPAFEPCALETAVQDASSALRCLEVMKSLNCSNGCLAKLQRKHLRHLQATKVIPSHPQKTQLQLGQMQQLKLTGQHEQLGTMSLMLFSVGASQMQKCLCVVCLWAYLPCCFSWQPWNTYTGNASHGWRATAWHMLY